MFNVQTAQSIIGLITLLLAYLFSVTLAGYFRAWVATKCGDTTARSLGFLTLNPLMHIDFFGILMLLYFKFGWGKFVPINPLKFRGKYASLKLIGTFLSDTMVHLTLASLGITTLILIFGKKVLFMSQPLSHAFPDISSALIAVGSIIISVIGLNAMLAVVSFILSTCGLGIMFFLERHREYNHYSDIAMIVLPLLILVLFAEPLHYVVGWLIIHMGYFIATLFYAI